MKSHARCSIMFNFMYVSITIDHKAPNAAALPPPVLSGGGAKRQVPTPMAHRVEINHQPRACSRVQQSASPVRHCRDCRQQVPAGPLSPSLPVCVCMRVSFISPGVRARTLIPIKIIDVSLHAHAYMQRRTHVRACVNPKPACIRHACSTSSASTIQHTSSSCSSSFPSLRGRCQATNMNSQGRRAPRKEDPPSPMKPT